MAGQHLTIGDLASRMAPQRKPMAKKKAFRPGGEKGKLHRELGIPEDQKIPADRLSSAARSNDSEIRRDAIRAQTMKGWHHGGPKKTRRQALYGK